MVAKQANQILSVIHSDLVGPMQTKSLQGSFYTATFVDDYSSLAVIYFLKTKDQFLDALNKYINWATTQTPNKICILQSDRGGKYTGAKVRALLNEKGIDHELTMPGTPQQNGKAKRFNCTIMDKALAMLHQAGLSNGFWEHAVSTVVHVYNRTPIHSLRWTTPHEAWNVGHIPDVSYFHIFRCKAYMHVPADKRRKLDAKAIPVVFVGYEPGSKGYRLWDKNTCSVHLSRDVTFDESSFPAKNIETEPLTHQGLTASPPHIPTPFYPANAEPDPPAAPLPPRAASPTSSAEDEDQVDDLLEPKVERPAMPPTQGTLLLSTPTSKRPPPSTPLPCPLASHFYKREEDSPIVPGGFDPVIPMGPRQSAQVPVPNRRYLDEDNAEYSETQQLEHTELFAVAYIGRDLVTYTKALKSKDADEWQKACQYEIDALAKNDTWELVDLLAGHKAVKSKCVFKLKADGRFRTRLVAKGFMWIPGIDYDETFSLI